MNYLFLCQTFSPECERSERNSSFDTGHHCLWSVNRTDGLCKVIFILVFFFQSRVESYQLLCRLIFFSFVFCCISIVSPEICRSSAQPCVSAENLFFVRCAICCFRCCCARCSCTWQQCALNEQKWRTFQNRYCCVNAFYNIQFSF